MTSWLGLALDLTLLAALASGIGLLLLGLMRTRSAAARNGVLVTGLVLVALTPAFAVLGRTLDLHLFAPIRVAAPTITAPEAPSPANAQTNPSGPASGKPAARAPGFVATTPEAAPQPPSLTWLAPGLLLLWLAGALHHALRIARGHSRAFRLAQHSRPTRDPRLLRIAGDAAAAARLRRPPRLCVSELVPAPITLGLLAPRIVLPPDVAAELDPNRLRAVVLHEMAHVANRDRWLRVLQQLVMVCHWWNPLVRTLMRRVNAVREELCDELAVTAVSPLEFADVLVRLAAAASHRSIEPAACAVLGKGELEQRVRRLLNHPLAPDRREKMHVLNRGWIALAAACQSVVLTFAAGTLAAQSTATLEVTVRWQNGDPAVGQSVVTQELAAANSSLAQRFATTDQNGVATITGLTPGLVMVRTAARQTLLDTVPADRTYRHTVKLSGCTVDGTVVAAGSSTPIAGARVLLWTSILNQEGEQVAVTDAHGAFTLRDVPDGFRIGVRAAGFAPTRPLVVRARGERVAMAFAPTAADGRVSGTVVDVNGQPIAGAQVFVGPEWTEARGDKVPGEIVVTDASGAFRCDCVAPGPLTIKARATGHGPAAIELDVAGAETVTLTLQPEVRIRGVVLDERDRPVARANLFVGQSWTFCSAHTMTAADGSFELAGAPAGELELHANDNKQLRCKATLTTTAGEIATWNPRVGLGDRLSGRVLDAHGRPLSGWYVYAICAGDDFWYRGGHTDAEGRFAFGQRPATGTFSLSTNPRGSAAAVLVSRDVDATQSQDLVVPDGALPSGTVKAHFVDANGQPVAGAVVKLSFAGMLAIGRHAADPRTGRVEIGPLPPRDYQLQVEVNGRILKDLGTATVGPEQVVDLGVVVID
ncbi:MAG: carboxypeptidase regulatory-like domain-containing protein [Planctomycetes bacterium]|nr:carboxypeptidase regulatory-like domain-containing protein [Planctomycetota bacterium]